MAARRAAQLLCPRCRVEGRDVQMGIRHVAPGALDAERRGAIATPHWRYRCPGCTFTEIHDRLIYEDIA